MGAVGGVLEAFPRYWKGAIAALTPVFVAVQAAVTDDTITKTEWVTIVVAVIVAGGVVAKGNAPAPGDPAAGERLAPGASVHRPTGEVRGYGPDMG